MTSVGSLKRILLPFTERYIMGTSTLTVDCVRNVIRNNYSILPQSMSKSNGYDCENFIIQAPNGLEGFGTVKYFVKAIEGSENAKRLRMQHAMLEHVIARGITASRPLKTVQGDTIVKFSCSDQPYVMQLLTYLEGVPLNNAIRQHGDLSDLSTEIGTELAKLHKASEDCDWDKSILILDAHGIGSVWCTGQGVILEDYLNVVKDSRLKILIQKYIDESKRCLLPRLSHLRRGTVHGDFSDTNILLSPSSEGAKSWKISGIIDFEDACYGYLSGDLGVCIAYLMMKSASLPDSDPIDIAGKIIQGYQAINPLTDAEKETFFEVVVERLIVSYVMGKIKVQKNPENEENILLQSKHVPRVLGFIEADGRDEVVKKLFLES